MEGRLGELWTVRARFRTVWESRGLRSAGRFDWDGWAEQEQGEFRFLRVRSAC
jgi:hypothetical protein